LAIVLGGRQVVAVGSEVLICWAVARVMLGIGGADADHLSVSGEAVPRSGRVLAKALGG
jgi:hypothetical protein